MQPLMRADFTLFDEYEYQHQQHQHPLDGAPAPAAFDFPITAFWGSRDRRIKPHMVQVCGEGATSAWEMQPGCSERPTVRALATPHEPTHLQGWSKFTSGDFRLLEVEGHHLWPLERAGKAAWLQAIADQLEADATAAAAATTTATQGKA